MQSEGLLDESGQPLIGKPVHCFLDAVAAAQDDLHIGPPP
jgi:hypothetical protein